MAQNILIPISFDFRALKVHWEQTPARITGWWKGQHGEPGHSLLLAESISDAKRTFAIQVAQVPERQQKQLSTESAWSRGDEYVAEVCGDFDPCFFFHDTSVLINEDELRKCSRSANAWEMREEFLRLKRHQDAVSFLARWGLWHPGLRKHTSLAEMIALQHQVRNGLLSPRDWFASGLAYPTMTPSRSVKYPYFTMLPFACVPAIRMTVTIDLLRKLKFRTCARRDCGFPFQVTSRHKREYCSQSCAHVESVRRSRREAAEAKSGKPVING
jgi:hypothetical protein